MAFEGDYHGQIRHVAQLLKAADSALFVTGAGLSADSKLPTYRGIGGLYEDAITEEGMTIEMALSGDMMRLRPEVAWKHIARIEAACRGARPNRGHEVIAALESRLDRVWVLTQNVDGLHAAAGTKNLIDIHGDVRQLICTACSFNKNPTDFAGLDIPPTCPRCGSVLRPNVVLFGEVLPQSKLEQLNWAVAGGFDMVFSVGTSSQFPYIVQPVVKAKFAGIPTVEINPGTTVLSQMVDVKIGAGAAQALDDIWVALAREEL